MAHVTDPSVLRLSDTGEVASWLSRLVRFDSSNPPGREHEAQLWLAEQFESLGLLVDIWDIIPDRPNVVARWQGTGEGPSLILNGHVDVAEVTNEDAWTHPPFEGVVKDGIVHGRGSSDMKAGLAGFYFAIKALRDAGFEPRGDVVVESVMGEERGEAGTRACIERGYTADFAIVGEDTDLGIVANLGTLTGCIRIAAPSSLHVGLRVQYLHAGGGIDGANMLEKMAQRLLPALNDLERHWANQRTHPMFPAGQEIISPFLIEGGGNPYITPDECRLYFIVYYLPGRSRAEVCAEIEEQVHLAAMADTWLRRHPPEVSWNPPGYPSETAPSDIDLNAPPVALLDRCHREALGTKPEAGRFGFASDAGWLYQAGIPTVCYGPGDPLVAHQENESIAIGRVVDYASILTRFIRAWSSPEDRSEGRTSTTDH